MKCPHCKTGIAAEFKTDAFADHPRVVEGEQEIHRAIWSVIHMRCPECHDAIISLGRRYPDLRTLEGEVPETEVLVYPSSNVRDVPTEVIEPYSKHVRFYKTALKQVRLLADVASRLYSEIKQARKVKTSTARSRKS